MTIPRYVWFILMLPCMLIFAILAHAAFDLFSIPGAILYCLVVGTILMIPMWVAQRFNRYIVRRRLYRDMKNV